MTTGDTESIYDALGKPARPYLEEVNSYVEGQYRRGLVQSVMPSTLGGMLLGFVCSIRPSKVAGRHIGRSTVIARYTLTAGAAGFIGSALHQALVMYNNYADSIGFSLGGMMVGSVVIMGGLQAVASPPVALFMSAIYATVYVGGDQMKRWYQEQWLTNFLLSQQLQQVPVHKIAPELQPAYRSYLYWHRPPEEYELQQRRYAVLAANEDSTRLDATTSLTKLEFEFWEWINFPDWWPVKIATASDEGMFVRDRQWDELNKKTESMLRDNPQMFVRFFEGSKKSA